MDNENREAFLNHLAEQSGRPRHQLAANPLKPLSDLPANTLTELSPADLLDLAKTNSEAVHVTFKVVSSADLPAILDQFVSDNQAKSVVLPTTDQWERFGLEPWRTGLTPAPRYWQPGATREANLAAAQADVGIGFADYLLAESGTITAATTPGQGRAFHFLPTHYLSIVPQSRVVPRGHQAMVGYEAAMASGELNTSNINFITGPSNSGDIEMVLIVGVHGPLDMTYVVVSDQ